MASPGYGSDCSEPTDFEAMFEEELKGHMELKTLLQDTDSLSRATDQSWESFEQFLRLQGKDSSIYKVENLAVAAPLDPPRTADLDHQLQLFYCSVRKMNTLISLRFGLRCYYDVKFDINDINFFPVSCRMYFSVLKHLRDYSSKPFHTNYVSNEDLRRCEEYFRRCIHTARGLLEYVWFAINLCLGLRGSEKQTKMTRETLAIFTDSKGRRYLTEVILVFLFVKK